MQRVRLTKTTLLPLNAYGRQELNQKSLDDNIWVNTVTLHDPVHLHSHFSESTSHGQCAPMEERLSANEFRLQRQLQDESRLKYEKLSDGETHFCWEWRYCYLILDVHLRFQRIPIPRDSITLPIPTMLWTLMLCIPHLAVIQKYYQWWTTIMRPGNARIPLWSCGTKLTASLFLYRDGNRVSQWLALGAHKYRDFLILRLFIHHRSPVHGWGRCMQSKFWALTAPAQN